MGPNGPKWLHLSFVLKVFGAKCKKGGFHVQISKNVKMCETRFSTTRNSENFSELSQKSHFRHVGFHYSGAEKPVPFCSLFAGEHFGAQNAFWGPKTHFGPQNAFLGPKMHCWAHFCPLAADAYETNGFCIGFYTFGDQMRKLAPFRTLGSKNGK